MIWVTLKHTQALLKQIAKREWVNTRYTSLFALCTLIKTVSFSFIRLFPMPDNSAECVWL